MVKEVTVSTKEYIVLWYFVSGSMSFDSESLQFRVPVCLPYYHLDVMVTLGYI